ncbi:MAG: DUF1232 domain-containing protein [Brevinema sp.]
MKKVKDQLTDNVMMTILNSCYDRGLKGIPILDPKSVEELAEDYIKLYGRTDEAIKNLVNSQIMKCGASGFWTSLGGVMTLPIAIPANLSSVLYMQLRMISAIAYIRGYNPHNDKVRTFSYVCLTGTSFVDLLKPAGIKLAEKASVTLITKIPGKVIRAINKAVGFRLVTKFGEKGIINLGKLVPFIGGVIGGSLDVFTTNKIADNAKNTFIIKQSPFKAFWASLPQLPRIVKKNINHEQLEERIKKYAKPNLSNKELKKAEALKSNLRNQMGNFSTILDMVKDCLSGKYKIESNTLLTLIGSIIYVISPLDLIPDFIPIIGWLDDIAAVRIVTTGMDSIIKGYKIYRPVQTTVNNISNNLIEQKVIGELIKVNLLIDKQYESFWKQFLIEATFFVGVIAAKLLYPALPAKEIIWAFIIAKGLCSMIRITIASHRLLIKIHFYNATKFWEYWKKTKSFQKALMMDMRNFYDYHYHLIVHPAWRFAHKVGSIVKLTPDNDKIFNHIYDSLQRNIPLILKKELKLFVCFVVFYWIVLSILRRLILHFII